MPPAPLPLYLENYLETAVRLEVVDPRLRVIFLFPARVALSYSAEILPLVFHFLAGLVVLVSIPQLDHPLVGS